MDEIYFCMHLTENEHYIVEDVFSKECEKLGLWTVDLKLGKIYPKFNMRNCLKRAKVGAKVFVVLTLDSTRFVR